MAFGTIDEDEEGNEDRRDESLVLYIIYSAMRDPLLMVLVLNR